MGHAAFVHVFDMQALADAIDHRKPEAGEMRIRSNHPVAEFILNSVGHQRRRRQHRHAAVPDAAPVRNVIGRLVECAAVLVTSEPGGDQVPLEHRLEFGENVVRC